MATFGSFETFREISSGQGADMFAARKTGETQEYAVKVFSLDMAIGDDPQTKSDLDPILLELTRSFTGRIQIQKTTAEKSPYVAPILASGRDHRGAWYVTRLYARTLQKIISGRVALSEEAFLHVIRSITEGALAFQKDAGRSHGNLKPTNVLISGAAKMREAEVAVSDPLPGGEAEAALYQLADLRAIGRIIYQLVRRREMSDSDEWMILPILSSKEWTDIFGPRTAGWLEICNRLLDPNLSLNNYNLEKLAGDLKALQPKAMVPLPWVAVMAGALVLIGVGLFFAWPHFTQATLEISSDPPGAEIFIDGVQQPKPAPLKVRLKPRDTAYHIIARYEGLANLTNEISVVKAGAIPLSFQFDYGRVEITSDPHGAHVISDEKNYGAIGDKLVVMQPLGQEFHYKFALDENHNTMATNVTATVRGQTIQVQAVLSELEKGKGTVVFDCDFKHGVSNAVWTAANPPVNQGDVPPLGTGMQLMPGRYTVHSTYKDWPEKVQTFEVTARTKTEVNIYFEHGAISLQSDPDGASVFFGARQVGATPLRLAVWPTGEVTFRLEKTGYETTNVTVTVADQKTVEGSQILITTQGFVELTTDPADSDIFDEQGNRLGTTFVKTNLWPGPYTFIARNGLLGEMKVLLEVHKRQTTKHTFAFPYGDLTLSVDPADATISWGTNHLQGQSSYNIHQRPDQANAYHIELPHYETVDTNIALAGGQKSTTTIHLLRNQMSIVLLTDPPGGEIFDEGGHLVPMKDSVATLRWGTYKFTAMYPATDLDPVTSDVVVPNDQDHTTRTFKFSYGTVVLTSSPPVVLVFQGHQIMSTPTNFYLKPPQKLTYDFVFENKTNTQTADVAEGQTVYLGADFETNILRVPLTGGSLRLVLMKPGFWVGQMEVSQWQYESVAGSNPSFFNAKLLGPAWSSNLPVESVTWMDATNFCHLLNVREKRWLAEKGLGDLGFTLPTTDEWTGFAGSEYRDKSRAVLYANAQQINTGTSGTLVAPRPVGSLEPNSRKLFDVGGNVWEWMLDNDSTSPYWAGSAFNMKNLLLIGGGYEPSGHADLKTTNVGFRVVLKTGAAAK